LPFWLVRRIAAGLDRLMVKSRQNLDFSFLRNPVAALDGAHLPYAGFRLMLDREADMDDSDASIEPAGVVVSFAAARRSERVVFTRIELQQILVVYGRKVAQGEWRDYALEFGRETATFSIFRRSSEQPLYRVIKTPKLAAKQGAFSVVASAGYVLRRGSDLERVLMVLEKPARAVP